MSNCGSSRKCCHPPICGHDCSRIVGSHRLLHKFFSWNYSVRFSFRNVQISISQSTDFHFTKCRFPLSWSPACNKKSLASEKLKKSFHIVILCMCFVMFPERSNWIICFSQKVYLRVYLKLRSHLTEKHSRGFRCAAGLRDTLANKHYYLHAL